MERLKNFCAAEYQEQKELKEKCGCVLGCPLFTLGAEVCNSEHRLHKLVKDILEEFNRYLESAIRDAHAQGLVEAPDPRAKARMIFAYSEGLLTQARILNDVEVLKEMPEGIFGILGGRPSQTVTATAAFAPEFD